MQDSSSPCASYIAQITKSCSQGGLSLLGVSIGLFLLSYHVKDSWTLNRNTECFPISMHEIFLSVALMLSDDHHHYGLQ